MTKPPPRHLPLILVMVAVFAAAGLGFGERWFSRHGANVTRTPTGEKEGSANSPSAARLSAEILVYPKPRALAPFLLQRAGGGTLGNADLRGSWTLAFFGFTHCPDVCPTALATMKQIEELSRKTTATSGARNLPLKYLFVSVDPERDTP
ncbi:MAG: SCO family protein, partial [Lysobacterales bacterium]